MKYSSLLFSLCVFAFVACQNNDKNVSNAAPTTSTPESKTGAPAPQVDMAEVSKTITASKAELENIDKLDQAINALPAAVKKANKANLEAIRSEVDGIEEKQHIMVKMLENYQQLNTPAGSESGLAGKAAPADNEQVSEAVIKDILGTVPRYHTVVEQYNQQVQELAKGQKKQ
jgi:hypothetical protein